VTVVMVTHDQEEAMTMASRIAIMSKGRVLQVGSPEEIYEHPANRFVADFIGNVNLFEGKLSVDEPNRCAASTAVGEIHVGHGVSGTLHMPVTIAVRPEKIEISKQRPEGVGPNLFSGKVKEIAYFGSYNTYIVQAAEGLRVKITEANTSRQDLSDITWEDNVFFWWSDIAGVVLRD
jgi:putrescine transport system ATP-binding protein